MTSNPELNLKITEYWLHDGELCIKGEAFGEYFSAVFKPTETDYGWNELRSLPAYRDEPEFTGIQDDEDLSYLLGESVDRAKLVYELMSK